jgi:tRNA(Ile)-lysidine synthase
MAGSRNKLFTEAVLQAVAACFSRHTDEGDSVVVGFSGGLDSTVLLHAASGLAGSAALELSAFHVHHGLSDNADAWTDSCARVCQALDVPFAALRVAVPDQTGEGVESSARRVRHKALADHPADWILLAHHADDQAETVLHNLLRGAGVRGAAAMPELHGRALRPLLRPELAKCIWRATPGFDQLRWIEDESNSDTRYTRNFLRREILPAISLPLSQAPASNSPPRHPASARPARTAG